MKRLLSILLCVCLLLSLAACGEQKLDPAEANKLVIWHDKEDAVIAALENYLATAAPDLEIIFEKKTSLTDSLKLVGNDPSAAPDMFIFAHDIGGPWMVPSARAAEIDLGIAPMPTVDSTGKALAPYSGVQGIHVLQFAAQQKTDAVKKLLAVLTDPTIGIDLALASGCAPANSLCYDDERVANDELVQSMRTTAEIAVPMPNIPEMDVMWTVVGNLLTDVNLSGKDINESFDAALKQANQLIDAMK